MTLAPVWAQSVNVHTDPHTPPWHALDAANALAQLATGPEGLAPDEAARRLAQHGPNRLPEAARQSALARLLGQFNNALILVLIGAAVLAAIVGHHVDAAVIVGVVLINALVGFVQEGRAQDALDGLRAMLAPHARVRRAGQRQTVGVDELVPGDWVLLEAGDRVPADLRIVRARGLLVDEAVLTGESVSAEKTEAASPEAAPLAERLGMLYSGTLVAAGQAAGVVVATGSATEIGRISGLLQSVEALETPLLRQINQFGRRFSALALAASALLCALAVGLLGYDWVDALMVVVAVAVSAIPEGLPAVITITLAIGVQRMAARHAIVRRLPAVETLGATTVICSDKTGTLTKNEMTARRLITADNEITVTGAGYDLSGTLELPAGQGALPTHARALIETGLLCNDAQVHEGRVDGDPMEGALVVLAHKAGLAPEALRAGHPRRDEIPFDASHRTMATLHAGGELHVKGAPEQVLALCSAQLDAHGQPQPLAPAHWHAAIARAAAQGERVLGFASRTLTPAPERLDADAMQGLSFIGLVGFIDPPRPEAIAAVADCQRAGIAVKMITGDHGATAAAIAGQLGLARAPVVTTGAELDPVSDADLPALAQRTQVFARTSPEHKLRVVRALQAQGEVVAMTGDGVNDAPSLKQADVGVAMGDKGTEAAKEAAQMVLTDDRFDTIVAAVREGRAIYDNIRKVIAWTLPTNGGEGLAIVIALLLGMTLPMSAAQILWVNMILTVTLGLALAFEPAEPGVMTRPPRRPDAPLISSFMLWRIVLVSLLFTAGVFGVFAWSLAQGHSVELARTLVVNTLCAMEMGYLFSVRYLHRPSFSWVGARGTPAVWLAVLTVTVAQAAFTWAPWMQKAFGTVSMDGSQALLVLGVGAAVFAVLEVEKAVLRGLGWFKDEL